MIEHRTALLRWDSEQTSYTSNVEHAEARVRDALAVRGHVAGETVPIDVALADYENACAERNEQAASAARRSALRQALHDREAAESAAAAARAQRENALRGLVDAARDAGIHRARR